MQLDIGTVVATHLRSLGPVPVDAGTLANAVDAAFLTIPRNEITEVEREYVLPRELVEDAAMAEQAHESRLVEAVAEALREGFVVIEMPTRHELPPLPQDRSGYLVRFKLVARARRVAAQKIASRSGE